MNNINLLCMYNKKISDNHQVLLKLYITKREYHSTTWEVMYFIESGRAPNLKKSVQFFVRFIAQLCSCFLVSLMTCNAYLCIRYLNISRIGIGCSNYIRNYTITVLICKFLIFLTQVLSYVKTGYAQLRFSSYLFYCLESDNAITPYL